MPGYEYVDLVQLLDHNKITSKSQYLISSFLKINIVLFGRKQAWLWSLGDAYRIKDRPRYMSSFGMNSALDTIGPNPLRYSVGDNNNNNEVC